MDGIYSILPTPFDEAGMVDQPSLRRLVDFVIDTGVDGLTILGFLGEAAKLTEAERAFVYRTIVDRPVQRNVVVTEPARRAPVVNERIVTREPEPLVTLDDDDDIVVPPARRRVMTETTGVAVPADAIVTDARTDEYYVLRADGSKRPITKEEQVPDVTQADLIATESGEAISPEWHYALAALDAMEQQRPDEQIKIVEEIAAYLEGSRNARGAADLARRAVWRLKTQGNWEVAVKVARAAAELRLNGDDARMLQRQADTIEGEQRLGNSIGMPFDLTGTTVNGMKLDVEPLRGKVVLVVFWFVGCRPCVEEIPDLKDMYRGIAGIGNDVLVRSGRSCGSILVERMTIAGD